jgi:hypothetical protein
MFSCVPVGLLARDAFTVPVMNFSACSAVSAFDRRGRPTPRFSSGSGSMAAMRAALLFVFAADVEAIVNANK